MSIVFRKNCSFQVLILSNFKNLPISGEYLHRECYDAAKKYSKDTFIAIDKVGPSFIPKFFEFKRKIDLIAEKLSFLPNKFSERLMQFLSHFWSYVCVIWQTNVLTSKFNLQILTRYYSSLISNLKFRYFSNIKTSGRFIQFSVTFSENRNLNKVWFIYIITISKSTPRILWVL